MSDNPPSKNHIVTAGYLPALCPQLARDGAQGGRGFDEGVAGVGYQRDFWGSDPELATEMEEKLQPAERRALRVLRELPSRWPLAGADRGVLGEFLAIHIARLPSFAGYFRQVGEQANREAIAEGAPKHGLNEAEAAVYAQLLRSDRIHAAGLLRQIPRMGSVLCSMHWLLVEFPNDWLITGDQPVVMLGPPPHHVSPASAIGPFANNAVEVRFALDPRHALLLTWLDGADEQVC